MIIKRYKLLSDNDIFIKPNIEELTVGQRIKLFIKSILSRKFYENHNFLFYRLNKL